MAAQMESVRSQGQYKAQLTKKKNPIQGQVANFSRNTNAVLQEEETDLHYASNEIYTHLQIRDKKTRDLKTIS